jgi:hypothetical protein
VQGVTSVAQVGYYARTSLQMASSGSEAPVYSKPGEGSSKLYLLSYKVPWCTALQCSAVQCSVVQCSAVQCCAVQCNVVQCSEPPPGQGSWVVAKDPFAGPSTMQYRMFQESRGSSLPLEGAPWTVGTEGEVQSSAMFAR